MGWQFPPIFGSIRPAALGTENRVEEGTGTQYGDRAKPAMKRIQSSGSAMSSRSTAELDRRVVVIDGPDAVKEAVRRVSDLRSSPFVVFLGEPGIGKSTVLEREAEIEGGAVVKVRKLINGAPTSPGATLFLDALDEYRVEGSRSDKADSLANAISGAETARDGGSLADLKIGAKGQT
jgi:hypothetical protein